MSSVYVSVAHYYSPIKQESWIIKGTFPVFFLKNLEVHMEYYIADNIRQKSSQESLVFVHHVDTESQLFSPSDSPRLWSMAS